MVIKCGLHMGGPGLIPTATTTITTAGGDAEHVSLNIPKYKIGTSKT